MKFSADYKIICCQKIRRNENERIKLRRKKKTKKGNKKTTKKLRKMIGRLIKLFLEKDLLKIRKEGANKLNLNTQN